MVLIGLVIGLLVLSYVLSRSTDVLISGINQLARGTSLESYGVTTFLVALATSLPELFVGVTAAITGEQVLALGVVVGSNIANISLVIACAAIVSGRIKAQDKALQRDMAYVFLVASLPHIMLLDKVLTRIEGLILLVVYGVFVLMTMSKRKRQRLEKIDKQYYQDHDWGHRILRLVGKKDVEQGLGRLVVGSATLVVAADLIVLVAGMIAKNLNIPLMMIGLFVVSVGASLPDISFSLKSSVRGQYVMIFGNLFGALVVKSSLILGLVAVISPINLETDPRIYFSSVIAFVVVYVVFWIFTMSKREVNRLEGWALLGCYFLFLAVEFLWL